MIILCMGYLKENKYQWPPKKYTISKNTGSKYLIEYETVNGKSVS